MKTTRSTLAAAAVLALGAGAASAQELLFNPGFEDLDSNGSYGDGWGSFGAAGFHAFFGANGHASLFADNAGNFGGVSQLGIAGAEGTEYAFSLTDMRIEENFDADLRFGLEFYAGDDATKISEVLVDLDTTTTPAPTGDGLVFDMSAVAPAGTVFVRPIVLFDDAVGDDAGQENAFVFDASLTAVVVPEPASLALAALAAPALLMRRRRAK